MKKQTKISKPITTHSSTEELYDDLKDSELDIPLERIRKSIGWVEPVDVEWNRKDSNIKQQGTEWDVYLGDGSSFTCEEQEHAEMFSYLVQINERLKRLERGKK